ncbi:MAG: hypothetical protein PQJ44_06965 [Sphaerochaetaceae bacterium]|nr:hypothetical protein [Sphaerochaetaceae bacterium]
MAIENAIGLNVTGVVTSDGSGGFTGNSVTQYGTVIAGASNAISSVAPSATSGVPLISQGASSNPAYGTAVVAGGGTGVTSTTAYAVICGGTTSTAALQSIASVGTSGQVLTSNGAGALPTFQDATGSMPPKEYWFSAESLQPLETNFAPLEKLTGTNQRVFVRAFDDTTQEYVNGKLQVPGDVDTSGTVTIRCYIMAKTAAASKNIELQLGYLALNDSEDFDQAASTLDSGDIAVDATQDDLTEATFTETISNLGWSANDLVLFSISRIAPSANNLSGDLYLFSMAIEIPRS